MDTPFLYYNLFEDNASARQNCAENLSYCFWLTSSTISLDNPRRNSPENFMQSVIDVGPRSLGLLRPISNLVYSTLSWGLFYFWYFFFPSRFFQILWWCVCIIFATSTCSTYPARFVPDTCPCVCVCVCLVHVSPCLVSLLHTDHSDLPHCHVFLCHGMPMPDHTTISAGRQEHVSEVSLL